MDNRDSPSGESVEYGGLPDIRASHNSDDRLLAHDWKALISR